MKSFDIAHINEQGVDLIIVPLDSAFGHRMSKDQNAFIHALTLCAQAANLAGTVVPVWLVGDRFHFIAPQGFHPYFQSLDWAAVGSMINKTLSCG